MSFPGYVVWLSDGEMEFPHFVFSADTDMTIIGLLSLSSTNCKELVLCHLNSDELAAGEPGIEAAAERIRATLARPDLNATKVLRVEQQPVPAGVSFQEFRRSYKPPKLIYQSIFSAAREAFPVREQEPEDFISQGGHIQWVHS